MLFEAVSINKLHFGLRSDMFLIELLHINRLNIFLGALGVGLHVRSLCSAWTLTCIRIVLLEAMVKFSMRLQNALRSPISLFHILIFRGLFWGFWSCCLRVKLLQIRVVSNFYPCVIFSKVMSVDSEVRACFYSICLNQALAHKLVLFLSVDEFLLKLRKYMMILIFFVFKIMNSLILYLFDLSNLLHQAIDLFFNNLNLLNKHSLLLIKSLHLIFMFLLLGFNVFVGLVKLFLEALNM